MTTLLTYLTISLAVIGGILLALGTISAIGYGLYLWGSVGLALPASAWGGFVLWMHMFGTGGVFLILSWILSKVLDK